MILWVNGNEERRISRAVALPQVIHFSHFSFLSWLISHFNCFAKLRIGKGPVFVPNQSAAKRSIVEKAIVSQYAPRAPPVVELCKLNECAYTWPWVKAFIWCVLIIWPWVHNAVESVASVGHSHLSLPLHRAGANWLNSTKGNACVLVTWAAVCCCTVDFKPWVPVAVYIQIRAYYCQTISLSPLPLYGAARGTETAGQRIAIVSTAICNVLWMTSENTGTCCENLLSRYL